MTELAERAIAHITMDGGANRDTTLAVALGVRPADVAEALAPACESGELVSCVIQRPAAAPINEYRISASLPRFNFRTLSAPEQAAAKARVRQARDAIARGGFVTAAAAAATKPSAPVARDPQGDRNMETQKIILTHLGKRGPVSPGTLATLCGIERFNLNYALKPMLAAGMVEAAGATTKRMVYLPEDRDKAGAMANAAPAKSAKKGPIKRKAVKTAAKVPRKTAKRTAKATRIVSVSVDAFHPNAGSFRPAVAADGALLLMGAALPGELNQAEFSVLVGFMRKMDDGGMFAQ